MNHTFLRIRISHAFWMPMLLVLLTGCQEEVNAQRSSQDLTIFFINDPHSRLENFAKIKHIVDEARTETEVLLVAAGDIFSGSPIVDQYEQKGYPIIDIMNRTGFDVVTVGNHEFDYGTNILDDRMAQSEFEWICANVNTEGSDLRQPNPFYTAEVGGLKITFLGLVETNGKPGTFIPSTHPWRVADLEFRPYYDVAAEYNELKKQESADLLVALTHLGLNTDKQLAEFFTFFDMVIGGHTNNEHTGAVNGTPVLMAGKYLSHLGRIDLTIKNRKINSWDASLIDLSTYDEEDVELAQVIDSYQNAPQFEEVVGNATSHHNTTEIGCFYTTALMDFLNVDLSMQNTGGIRDELNEGEITKLEIFNIDPFNNGTVIFTKSVAELSEFLIESASGFHITGVTIEKDGQELLFKKDGQYLGNNDQVTIGINDYIPAVYDQYFSLDDADVKDMTTAETLIAYLTTINSTVNHEGCNHYFKY